MAADVFFENARLRALHRSGLLDPASQDSFQSLTELVCDVLDVPISFVSLVAGDRQVFVGHTGIPDEWARLGETPLSLSFCKHVVARAACMRVDDARSDPTVRDNGAIEALGIVSYLGVPLRLPSGEVVGALAAADGQPRTWSAAELRRLERIAEIATKEIAVRVSEVKWRSLFEDMQEGFYVGEAVRDEDGRFVDFRFVDINPAFETLTGIEAASSIGRLLSEAFPGIDPGLIEIYDRVLKTGMPEIFEIYLPTVNDDWFEGRARALGNDRFAVVFTSIGERKREQIRLASVEERRRLATKIGDVGLWDWDIEAGTLDLDDQMMAMNGVVAGRALSLEGAFAAIHPDDRERVERELATLTEGRTEDVELEYRVVGVDDGIVRTVLVSGLAMRNDEGKTVRIVGSARDVSERVAHELRRTILNQELAHRLKNTLAIVTALVTQSLRSASDVETGRKTLLSRIQALSKAHDLLLSGQREASNVRSVISAAAALHDEGGRVTTSGPNLPLGPKASLTLSLIVHELATNAGKYGGLSVPDGTVKVSWSVLRDEERRPVLDLSWEELGGPPVVAPQRKGFGTRLIEMGLSGSVDGKVELDYAPDGVRCRIVAPLVELMTEDEAAAD